MSSLITFIRPSLYSACVAIYALPAGTQRGISVCLQSAQYARIVHGSKSGCEHAGASAVVSCATGWLFVTASMPSRCAKIAPSVRMTWYDSIGDADFAVMAFSKWCRAPSKSLFVVLTSCDG